MSDLINPLIMTEDGHLRPFAYGMPCWHDLGTIDKARQAVEHFRDTGAIRIHALLEHAFARLPVQGCVDWHAHLTEAA
ncbi:hypothetical protein [Nonomuraea sp. JJY05]|uniref:hypothetical protein n=1 Tax=Nonomuraea sp. JJY05 TaxID=3350255 RepID=UPI00373EA73E